MLGLALTAARAVAPVSAGAMYDYLGTYLPIFGGLAGLSLLAAGAILLIGRDAQIAQPH
jgi:hypothetical protein